MSGWFLCDVMSGDALKFFRVLAWLQALKVSSVSSLLECLNSCLMFMAVSAVGAQSMRRSQSFASSARRSLCVKEF